MRIRHKTRYLNPYYLKIRLFIYIIHETVANSSNEAPRVISNIRYQYNYLIMDFKYESQ